MRKESSPETIVQLLSHAPLFQSLATEQLATIGSQVVEIRQEKGDTLFRAGETPSGFYFVAFGQMKLVVSSPLGDEKVLEIIGPRQSFGEAVMFLQRPYPVTAIALAETWLLKISQQCVDELLATDPSFAKRMLAGLSFRLHSLVQDVESYSMRSSTQRVIGYLLQYCTDDSASDIVLPTSKLIIASRLNLTPETLSRVFQELTRNRLIDVQGRSVHIPDPRRLREFIG